MDRRFGMRFLQGQNVGDSELELMFLGPQSSQSPKLHDIFHEKKGVAATFWGVDDLLRFRIAMVFQVWLTVWGIQLPTGKKNVGGTYRQHHEENCRSWGKVTFF